MEQTKKLCVFCGLDLEENEHGLEKENGDIYCRIQVMLQWPCHLGHIQSLDEDVKALNRGLYESEDDKQSKT